MHGEIKNIRRKATIYDHASPFLRIVPDEEDTGTLWVVFSHVDTPEGKFAQSRVFESISGSKVFLNCATNSWYQAGIGGELDNVEKLVKYLASVAVSYKKVRVVGHSMGAYMALAMQHSAHLEYAVISSPEPDLLVDQSRSALNGVKPMAGWQSLSRRFGNRSYLSPGVVVYGSYDPVDAYFIANLERHHGLYRCVVCAPHHHGVTEYLSNLGVYSNFLARPFETLKMLLSKRMVDYPSRFGTPNAYRDFYELYRLMKLRAPDDTLVKAFQKRSNWENKGWQTLRASAMRRVGQLQHAIGTLEAILDPLSFYSDPALEYARCLRQEGNTKRIKTFLDQIDEYKVATVARSRIVDTLTSFDSD